MNNYLKEFFYQFYKTVPLEEMSNFDFKWTGVNIER